MKVLFSIFATKVDVKRTKKQTQDSSSTSQIRDPKFMMRKDEKIS